MVKRILRQQLKSEMDGKSSERLCHFWHLEVKCMPVVSELSSIYGNETRLLLDDGGLKIEKADMQNFNSLA